MCEHVFTDVSLMEHLYSGSGGQVGPLAPVVPPGDRECIALLDRGSIMRV